MRLVRYNSCYVVSCISVDHWHQFHVYNEVILIKCASGAPSSDFKQNKHHQINQSLTIVKFLLLLCLSLDPYLSETGAVGSLLGQISKLFWDCVGG
jgi:hypothetical protein